MFHMLSSEMKCCSFSAAVALLMRSNMLKLNDMTLRVQSVFDQFTVYIVTVKLSHVFHL